MTLKEVIPHERSLQSVLPKSEITAPNTNSVDTSLPQGGRILHLRGYDVTYFGMEDFLQNFKDLKKLSASYAHAGIGWSMRYSLCLAEQGLNVDNLTMGAPLNDRTIAFILDDPDKARKIPSVALISRQDSPDKYIALTAQRAYYPEIQETPRIRRVVPVTYNILRVVLDPNDRGDGIGKLIAGVTLILHKDTTFFMHRTSNYIAAYANTRSDSLDQKDNAPWCAEYSDKLYLSLVANSTYALIKRPEDPDMDEKGVVRGAYSEPNLAIPNPLDEEGNVKHEGSMRIWRKMHEEYNMGPLDGIVPIYRVAKEGLKSA